MRPQLGDDDRFERLHQRDLIEAARIPSIEKEEEGGPIRQVEDRVLRARETTTRFDERCQLASLGLRN
jgi:hypothetical protein